MKYSRDMESEADEYGVQELYDAGIDPNGLPAFFEKLAALEAQSGAGELDPVSKMFTSHPTTPDRIAKTRATIAKLPPKPGLRVDSPEFQKIKKRVSGK
jgi:predicted Zn-dependent protease